MARSPQRLPRLPRAHAGSKMNFRFLIFDFRLAVAPCGGAAACDEYRGQFMRFACETGKARSRHKTGITGEFYSERTLVSFLLDDCEIVPEIRSRAGTARSPIICSHRRSGAHELICNRFSGGASRERFAQFDRTQRELLRAFLQFDFRHASRVIENPQWAF